MTDDRTTKIRFGQSLQPYHLLASPLWPTTFEDQHDTVCGLSRLVMDPMFSYSRGIERAVWLPVTRTLRQYRL